MYNAVSDVITSVITGNKTVYLPFDDMVALTNLVLQVQETADKLDNLNIENGEGAGSIQQKSTEANGTYSTAIGTGTVADGNKAFAGGTRSKANGNSSFSFGQISIVYGLASDGISQIGSASSAVGYSCEVKGSFSHARGLNAKAYQRSTYAYGNGVRAGMTEEEYNALKEANPNGYTSLYEEYTMNAYAFGQGTVANKPWAAAFGYNGSAKGAGAFVVGNTGVAEGDWSFVGGEKAKSTNNGIQSISYGHETKVNAYASAAFGYGTITNALGQFVAGKWNSGKSNTLFEVGNGIEQARANAFEVLNDGRAKLQSAPTEENDVVRKKELDEKVNKNYVDSIKSELQGQLVGKVDYLGLFNDESGETLWTNTEHITAGDYFISAIEDGNTGAKIGDIIIARVDHPSKPADWDVIEANHEVLPYEVFCDVQGVQKRGNAIWIFYGSGYVIAIPIEAGDGVVVEPNASYDAIRISSDGSSGGVPFVRLA